MEKPESAKDIAKAKAMNERMALIDAKKAQAQQAILLANSQAEDEDEDMPLQEEEGDKDWVPLFGNKQKAKGMPIPKVRCSLKKALRHVCISAQERQEVCLLLRSCHKIISFFYLGWKLWNAMHKLVHV